MSPTTPPRREQALLVDRATERGRAVAQEDDYDVVRLEAGYRLYYQRPRTRVVAERERAPILYARVLPTAGVSTRPRHPARRASGPDLRDILWLGEIALHRARGAL